jgi:hypothetical protein
MFEAYAEADGNHRKNLVRAVEREHLPLAAALDLAVTPGACWSRASSPARAASAFWPGSPRSFLESDHVRGLILGETFDRIAGHRRAG